MIRTIDTVVVVECREVWRVRFPQNETWGLWFGVWGLGSMIQTLQIFEKEIHSMTQKSVSIQSCRHYLLREHGKRSTLKTQERAPKFKA
jgi:hypothetical protein